MKEELPFLNRQKHLLKNSHHNYYKVLNQLQEEEEEFLNQDKEKVKCIKLFIIKLLRDQINYKQELQIKELKKKQEILKEVESQIKSELV